MDTFCVWLCMFNMYMLQHTATHWNTLQLIATHCNTLRHTAAHCNPSCGVLQHTATHCNRDMYALTHRRMLNIHMCLCVYVSMCATYTCVYASMCATYTVSLCIKTCVYVSKLTCINISSILRNMMYTSRILYVYFCSNQNVSLSLYCFCLWVLCHVTGFARLVWGTGWLQSVGSTKW